MSDRDLLVATAAGPVRGGRGGGVRYWLGIPYAAATRFGPAGPPRPSDDPVDRREPGPPAWQLSPAGEPVGTEHGCLSLNVWSPEGASGLPVLFWVHGGAFVTGAGADYDGAAQAARTPAVVVTVNYRLGAFGFGAGDGPSPAMTDLLAALAWVGEHAEAFGGDPGAVTLAGQSAGAAVVSSLMVTPAARGRFRAAIALSGFGWTHTPGQARATADALARELGRDPREVPALDLLHAGSVLAARSAPGDPAGVPFLPAVDGTVLPAAPVDAVRAGALARIPLWLGTCRDEMALFRPDDPAPERARLTAELWESGLTALATAQVEAGGTVRTSRFDHVPSLPPFDRLGPTHGADNACLWAHVPRFVERPLLGRPGGPMTAGDVAAAEALQDNVGAVLRGEDPPWEAWTSGDRPTAVFAPVPATSTVPAAG